VGLQTSKGKKITLFEMQLYWACKAWLNLNDTQEYVAKGPLYAMDNDRSCAFIAIIESDIGYEVIERIWSWPFIPSSLCSFTTTHITSFRKQMDCRPELQGLYLAWACFEEQVRLQFEFPQLWETAAHVPEDPGDDPDADYVRDGHHIAPARRKTKKRRKSDPHD
jgi:hypothetical protein